MSVMDSINVTHELPIPGNDTKLSKSTLHQMTIITTTTDTVLSYRNFFHQYSFFIFLLALFVIIMTGVCVNIICKMARNRSTSRKRSSKNSDTNTDAVFKNKKKKQKSKADDSKVSVKKRKSNKKKQKPTPKDAAESDSSDM